MEYRLNPQIFPVRLQYTFLYSLAFEALRSSLIAALSLKARYSFIENDDFFKPGQPLNSYLLYSEEKINLQLFYYGIKTIKILRLYWLNTF